MTATVTILEEFRTEKRQTVQCNLINARGTDGKPVTLEREGVICKVGVGTAMVRLHELMVERNRCSSLWYRFFHGSYAAFELDLAIKRLQRALDEVTVEWAELP
jgi:hypothetical protein